MEHSVVDRSFVLGIDGVPWDLLSRWAQSGELENFQRLFESGTAGPLESTVPPTTALAWPSIATGVRPDKHGIYSFRKLTKDHENTINTSNDVEQPPLWDLCSPSIVANVPMTYPARSIDGQMVTGMMTPGRDEGFTHPTELAGEIEEDIPDYEIGLSWLDYHDREDEFLEDLSDLLAARRSLMRHLMETDEWELFFFVYTEPDRLQHLIWDEEVILNHYRELDAILGEVLEYVNEHHANLFVVSDHGFGPISKYVYVNTILEEAGLMSRKDSSGSRSALERVGLRKDRVRGMLQKARLEKSLLAALPDPIVNNVASRIPGEHKLFDVDFADTKAFSYGYGGVYVNDSERFENGFVDSSERTAVKEEVKVSLNEFANSRSPSPISVYDGADVYPTDPDAPDLVVVGNDEYEVKTSLSESPVTDSGEKAGSHHSEGVFLATGPNVERGKRIEGATVFDVVPTLLQSRLDPLPAERDGEVLDIFEQTSQPATEDPEEESYRPDNEVVSYSEEFDDVEDRLKGLGYIE
ncbi:alkaline phosphatase family protein [Halostagnicola sp. A-GB9-2]|uniref:alkaline phosphatase family protein n=1 Tax=Halostagnicola sp. A-GB9-2 TaxID=3048066 RepID=UPI0024C0D6D7|nr:alkaline phosphatase family protein [Halostagnicola sp. A-GB9-2]MDJ1434190.1 alkaline phosphatase family protein [Halostagnicola sp. A-GB9-2]